MNWEAPNAIKTMESRMGVSYCISALSEEHLEGMVAWAKECGSYVPAGLATSRLPTVEEVKRVLENFSEFNVGLSGTGGQLDITVESKETTEFEIAELELRELWGPGPFTCPKQSTTLWIKHAEDGTVNSLSFHKGDPALAVRITQRLTRYCGSLVIFATGDGVPLFVTPDADPPVGLDSWLNA